MSMFHPSNWGAELRTVAQNLISRSPAQRYLSIDKASVCLSNKYIPVKSMYLSTAALTE